MGWDQNDDGDQDNKTSHYQQHLTQSCSLTPILLNMAGPKKLVLANLEGLTLLLGLLTNHFQPVFPDGHCRVHCSVIDRSVQCIFTHPSAAFIHTYPSLSL